MTSKHIMLSSSMSVARYRKMEGLADKRVLGEFIIERFEERYFTPILDSKSRHGFTLLAISCLVIETLESFYQGLADTKNVSCKMFRAFFARNSKLGVFNSKDDWFYKDIRCGILHQGETRGGWRVLRKGPLLDVDDKAINATRLLCEIRRAVVLYASKIETDETVWENFQKKMNSVCSNCEQGE